MRVITKENWGQSRKIAQTLSNTFNAPLFALITFTILLSYTGSLTTLLFLVVFGFTVLMPIALLCYLKKCGIIPDLNASKRKGRKMPFMCLTLGYLAGFIVLVLLNAPSIVSALMLCYAINILLAMLITLKWKISIHTAGVTGPVTALIFCFGIIALPLMLLVFPVGWARIRTYSHTLWQVLVGAILAIMTTYTQLFFYLKIF